MFSKLFYILYLWKPTSLELQKGEGCPFPSRKIHPPLSQVLTWDFKWNSQALITIWHLFVDIFSTFPFVFLYIHQLKKKCSINCFKISIVCADIIFLFLNLGLVERRIWVWIMDWDTSCFRVFCSSSVIFVVEERVWTRWSWLYKGWYNSVII